MAFLRWLNDHFNFFKIVRSLGYMQVAKHPVIFTEDINQNSDIDDMRLIFQQAELRNKSLNDRADSLYQKSLSFLGISISALSAITYHVINNETAGVTARYFSFWAVIILLTGMCLILKKNVLMSEYKGVGAHPSDLVHNDYYTNLNSKKPEWYILQRLIKDTQLRIEINRELNTERAENIKEAITWLYFIPGVVIIIQILFLILK